MVLFAAATGLRPGEWIALEQRDIDRQEPVVYVRRLPERAGQVHEDRSQRARCTPTGDCARSARAAARRHRQRASVSVAPRRAPRSAQLPQPWLSLVFSNSAGEMWALVQRALHEAGFSLEAISILDKGQRSVKGLASGFENVVTFDLILSMRKHERGERITLSKAADGYFEEVVELVLADGARTPSHVYLGVIRDYLSKHLDVTEVDMEHIATALSERGYAVDSASGKFVHPRSNDH